MHGTTGRGSSATVKTTVIQALALIVVLGVVAAIAPAPGSTDRGFYQYMGRELVVRDCADIHCFRPLVAGVLEHLPGPSLLKWKAYAVLANAIAALALGRFCLLLGLSASASTAAIWLCALGTGSLYSLFDSYTSDPLMYMLGPLTAIELWQGRTGRAGWMAAVGVFAKEFAAAPLWIFTALAVLSRRWPAAARTLLVSTAIMIVWLAKQAWLMAMENYRYGFTASVNLLHGGYIATWLDRVGLSGALMYLFTTFGALYVLLPGGLLRAGRDVRLFALASLPAAAAFLYVEQPERALWNFHFIVIPLAVLALEGLANWTIALFVAASGVVGLRFGAQLEIRSAARLALLIALATGLVAVVAAIRRRMPLPTREPAAAWNAPVGRARWVSAAIVEAVALVLLAGVLIDVHTHRRDEATVGVNQWGYRGPLRTAPQPGVRVAVVGGSAAFAAGTVWWDTVPAQLASAINLRMGWTRKDGLLAAPDGRPMAWVDNLAEPAAGPESYVATLRDYAYLRPDLVCIFDGYDTVTGGMPPHGRRRSFAFRTIGYLPTVPAALLRRPGPLSDPDGDVAPALQDGSSGAADPSCAGASASYCTAMADTVRFALQQGDVVVVATPPHVSARHDAQQRSLAEQLDREFGREPRFRYVNLGRTVDMRDPAQSADGLHPTVAAGRTLATHLAGEIVALIPRR